MVNALVGQAQEYSKDAGIRYVIDTPQGEVSAAPLPATDGAFVQVVSDSPCQGVLRDVRADLIDEDHDTTGVILATEPENANDPEAVAVTTFEGATMGYLAREEAARYQPILLELRQRGMVGVCAAKFVGGKGKKANIGLWVDVAGPMDVAETFGIQYRQPEAVATDKSPPPEELGRSAIDKTESKRASGISAFGLGKTGHHGFMGVVGESHYQSALRAIRRELKEEIEDYDPDYDELEFTATLVPEPDNPHDPNAVRVCGPEGETLGYLDKTVAKEKSRSFAITGPLKCEAELRGGTREKRKIGVVLEWDAVRARLAKVKLPQARQHSEVEVQHEITEEGDVLIVDEAEAAQGAVSGDVPNTVKLPGRGTGYFDVEVVEESRYQVALRELRADYSFEPKEYRDDDDWVEVDVILSPEPENAHDPKAVAVKTFDDDTVGYLYQPQARRYQPTLLELRGRGLTCVCDAAIFGGRGKKRRIRVKLDLVAPTKLAQAFGIKYQRQKHKLKSDEKSDDAVSNQSTGSLVGWVIEHKQSPRWRKDVVTGRVDVHLESPYEPALRALLRELKGEIAFTATLVVEPPDNPDGPDAVKVCGPEGETLCYLRASWAKKISKKLAITGPLECEAELALTYPSDSAHRYPGDSFSASHKPEPNSISVLLRWDPVLARLAEVKLPRKKRARKRPATDTAPITKRLVEHDTE